MTKLNDKDQGWLDENKLTLLDSGHHKIDYLSPVEVKDKLLEKQTEIDELKATHHESVTKWRDAFDKMHQRAIKSEQSLAEHDKQVKIDSVVHFCAWLVDNGEPIAEEELQVIGSKYINQLKDK